MNTFLTKLMKSVLFPKACFPRAERTEGMSCLVRAEGICSLTVTKNELHTSEKKTTELTAPLKASLGLSGAEAGTPLSRPWNFRIPVWVSMCSWCLRKILRNKTSLRNSLSAVPWCCQWVCPSMVPGIFQKAFCVSVIW